MGIVRALLVLRDSGECDWGCGVRGMGEMCVLLGELGVGYEESSFVVIAS